MNQEESVANAASRPSRKFWYHPSRQPQVDLALFDGSLQATMSQLRPFAWMPLEDSKGEAVLGWWVNEAALEPAWPSVRLQEDKPLSIVYDRSAQLQPLSLVDDRNNNPDYAAWEEIE